MEYRADDTESQRLHADKHRRRDRRDAWNAAIQRSHFSNALRLQVDALRALLRKHEWSGTWCQGGYGESECAECHADPSDGHKPGCALKAAIG